MLARWRLTVASATLSSSAMRRLENPRAARTISSVCLSDSPPTGSSPVLWSSPRGMEITALPPPGSRLTAHGGEKLLDRGGLVQVGVYAHPGDGLHVARVVP